MSRMAAAVAAALCLTRCFSGFDAPRRDEVVVHRGTFVQNVVLTGQLDAARGEFIAVPPLPSWQITRLSKGA